MAGKSAATMRAKKRMTEPEEPVLAIVGYFSEPLPDSVRTCCEILRYLLNLFGDQKVIVFVGERSRSEFGGKRISRSRSQSLKVRVEEGHNFIVERPDGGIGFECEETWGLSYSEAGYFGEGSHRMEPRLQLNIAVEAIPGMDAEGNYGGVRTTPANLSALRLAEAVAACLDNTGLCYSGLMDSATAEWIGRGSYYGGIPARPRHWMQDVERLDWLVSGLEERRRRVRGVYWGQYLGPDLARKFDPCGDFINRFSTLKTIDGFEGTQVARRLPKGAVHHNQQRSARCCDGRSLLRRSAHPRDPECGVAQTGVSQARGAVGGAARFPGMPTNTKLAEREVTVALTSMRL